MKLYTKTGDDGKSSVAYGDRISKCDIIFDVLGLVDELSSRIGIAKASDKEKKLYGFLEEIQLTLIKLMSGIASGDIEKYVVSDEEIKLLEDKTDELCKGLNDEICFSVAGKNELSARLDFARTGARTAERIIVKAMEKCSVSCSYVKYMNRLSDFLYAAARYAE